MTQHARFSPSAMHRIVRCPGSVRATAGLPEIPSPYAEDGTEAHSMLAHCLSNGLRSTENVYHEWVYRADDEKSRIESVQTTLDWVYDILDSYEDAKLYVEQRVLFPSNATDDECWGTADIVIVIPSLGLLHVVDFKHGAGTFVSVKDNEQLGVYATAALATIRGADECHTVITGIIQPRAFSEDGVARTDVQSSNYYTGIFRERIDAAIAAAIAPDAPLIPGEIQCRFCPLKANCPAREAAALAVVSDTFKSVKEVTRATLPLPWQLPTDRLAYIIQASHLLKDWIKDVENAATEILRVGGHVPGFKLVEARPQRRWNGEDAEIAVVLMSLTGLGEDEITPRKLIGITEADSKVRDAFKLHAKRGTKKQAAEEAKIALAHLTTKESSGNLSLAPVDDPRPAVNVAQIAFKNVQLTQETQE